MSSCHISNPISVSIDATIPPHGTQPDTDRIPCPDISESVHKTAQQSVVSFQNADDELPCLRPHLR